MTTRTRWFSAAASAMLFGQAAAASPDITLRVDLRDAPRRLIHATETIHGVQPGRLAIWYPKYVPGNHAASGPIRNVAGFEARDAQGRTLAWDRDPADAYRIVIETPEGGDVTIETVYIASQPWHMSRSSDTYGFPNFGALNWNTIVWYPQGSDCTELEVEASLESPFMNEFGCSLPGHTMRLGESVTLNWTGSLTELIDSPVIFGEHLTRHNIPLPDRWPEHVMWINAATQEDAELPDWMMERLRRMVHEATLIFGKFPRSEYHILCMADDSLSFGLEHATCTFLSAATDAFSRDSEPSDDEGGMRHLTVIPHEYIHVWCGKLRAPEGLIHPDYDTPVDGTLLWVYEGLTTYYTQVLAARSGMKSEAEFKQWVLDTVMRYARQEGRRWRSVEDTARDVEHVRGGSDHWGDLRRGADYYSNAALFWLEADALIRAETGGERSLDDFCKAFFDVEALPIGKQATYTRGDVVATLAAAAPGRDWDALIRERIESPDEDLSFSPLLEALGVRVIRSPEPSAIHKKLHKESKGADRRHSIGLALDEHGAVTAVVPGSAADGAGFAQGMKVIGVGGWVYSKHRLDDAIVDPDRTGRIELTVQWADRLEPRTIEYSGGPAWPVWGRIAGREDVLGQIAKPRLGGD